MPFEDHIRRALDALTAASLLRAPRAAASAQAAELELVLPDASTRRVLNLCSNNYLGLADDPRITAAAKAALDAHGFGAGGSRLITGTHALHRAAEARLARYVARPAALLFSTGYAANLGALSALCSRNDLILSDALNHASLIDGARLSRARVLVYRHADAAHAAELLAAHRAEHARALVVTESLFSMDGDFAPLAELNALAQRYDAGFFVDEAHALGVFGPQGRGLCAALGITPDVLVGTLGKALGASGAFVSGSEALVQLLENRARSYVFSTAAPAALAAAAITACDLVESADDRRAQLLAHAAQLRASLAALGYRVLPGESPIIPVLLGDPDRAMRLSAALLEHGVFVHGIRPPTVPTGTSRLRVTPMATHSDPQIRLALDAFSRVSHVS